ncbi:radical SAM/SPASM domain-containing protein [Streptomyces lavendulae]|uniref:radical SAM/SPASM domain-containing protein n=1 Tax=Streptomyces lavendulae TaxID=1914 RepID=UPI0036806314
MPRSPAPRPAPPIMAEDDCRAGRSPEPMLQTCPYLSSVRPGADPRLVYLTDTAGPEAPTGPLPQPTAVFGIVGLDRTIVWQDDAKVLNLLRYAASAPRATGELVTRFGPNRVSAAAGRGWLQDPAGLCREYRVVSGEIEVTAHCNWGCVSCPVATDPKPRRTMPMPLFEEIIGKLAAAGAQYVTFQFFNEPTLDRYFVARLEVLAARGMPLALYSNASALTADKIAALQRTEVLKHLIVNIPSAEEAEFNALTGSRHFQHTMGNTAAALEAGLPVQVVVNGVGARLARNLSGVERHFTPLGAEVYSSLTCDRAGELGGEYAQDVHVKGRLTGCGWPVQHVNISVAGDLFLCCNDYYQREAFGHVRDGSIDELMASERAVALRRKVFGVDQVPDDFLCRRCHNQLPDFPGRDFRPIAAFG